jgi:Transposase DDE domain
MSPPGWISLLTGAARTTNAPFSSERSNPIGCTRWIEVMPSLRSSTASSPPGAATSAGLRDNSAYEVLEERPLTDADRAAGILSDQIVRFSNGKIDARPDHPLRLICIATSPHTSRGKYGSGSTGPESDGILRIATNLLTGPAEIIGLIYRYRGTIEIFFRFFKHILGCRHLISHSENGLEIQTYGAIIACLVIALYTGRKPPIRTYEMICYYLCGLASEEELLAHLAKLAAQDEARQKK